jgi:hypothetical protein
MLGGRGIALVAIAAAAALGLGAGVVLERARSKPQPVLLPVSQWTSQGSGTSVVAGSLAADPKRGVVLYRDDIHGPSLFTMPSSSGPLHLVSSSDNSWVLETPRGTRAVLETAGDEGPRFEIFGRPLDPAHLPPLAQQGLAVPVTYGPTRTKAVLLVGAVGGNSFPLYGYLPHFSLPPTTSPSVALARPLLGPDHRLYRVARAERKLVAVGQSRERAAGPFKIPPRCSTWPTGTLRYLACADSIAVVQPDGSRTTLLRQPGVSQSNTRWTFLSSSPNGRMLLLEQDIYSCGTDRQAYFLSTSGGGLRRAVSDLATQSEPLGWLGRGAALVAVQYGECSGAPRSGIYRAYPSGWNDLILSTSGQDATLWGSPTGPLTSR